MSALTRRRVCDSDTDVVCLTVDVDWASQEVLQDFRQILDDRRLVATFFCTHPGISVPGHNRAIHPNFRRNGDTIRGLDGRLLHTTDQELYGYVVETTRAFCPEAIGVRAHSLFYDSTLLTIYREARLQYDSSYFLPLVPGLRPFWKEFGLLEIPIYYMDHADLIDQQTGFGLRPLALHKPGLKVFDFHPNIVFTNASTNEDYHRSKQYFGDYRQLKRIQRRGKGARSLCLQLLDKLADRAYPTRTLEEVSQLYWAAQVVRRR